MPTGGVVLFFAGLRTDERVGGFRREKHVFFHAEDAAGTLRNLPLNKFEASAKESEKPHGKM